MHILKNLTLPARPHSVLFRRCSNDASQVRGPGSFPHAELGIELNPLHSAAYAADLMSSTDPAYHSFATSHGQGAVRGYNTASIIGTASMHMMISYRSYWPHLLYILSLIFPSFTVEYLIMVFPHVWKFPSWFAFLIVMIVMAVVILFWMLHSTQTLFSI